MPGWLGGSPSDNKANLSSTRLKLNLTTGTELGNMNISVSVKSPEGQNYSELNTPLVLDELQDPLKQFLKK